MSHLTADNSRMPTSGIRLIRTRDEVTALVRDAIGRGCGGRLLLLDRAQRRELRQSTPAHADTTIALRRGLPGLRRQTTSPQIVDALCAACQLDRRRVFLVGGAPGRPGVPGGVQRAAAILGLRYRGLPVVGTLTGFGPVGDADPGGDAPAGDGQRALVAEIVEAKPDLVILGPPAVRGAWPIQEQLIDELRGELPQAWIFGSPGVLDELVGDAARRRGRFARRLSPAQ